MQIERGNKEWCLSRMSEAIAVILQWAKIDILTNREDTKEKHHSRIRSTSKADVLMIEITMRMVSIEMIRAFFSNSRLTDAWILLIQSKYTDEE